MALTLALPLSACGGGAAGPAISPAANYDYRQAHPILVAPAVATLRIEAEGAELKPLDRPRLAALAVDFIRKGQGRVAVGVGARNADDQEARAFARQIGQSLLEEGLKKSEIALSLVVGDPALAPGQARLSFDTSEAAPPDCEHWEAGESNASSANFGCATQHNIAAMLANPADLSRAQPMAGGDGGRIDGAIDKYRAGQAPWSVPLPWEAKSQSNGSGSGGQ